MVRGFALDAAGDVYATGLFRGTIDFNPDPNTQYLLSSAGETDIYVLKLGKQDGGFLAARRIGGPDYDGAQGQVLPNKPSIAVDHASGTVYLTSSFLDTADFGGPSLSSDGGSDAFLAELDADLNVLRARRFGGPEEDDSRGVAIGPGGLVHLVGRFQDTAVFPEGTVLTSQGGFDGFVTRLDPAAPIVALAPSVRQTILVEGQSVSLTAAATDDQNNDLSSQIVWTTLDGTFLGQGSSLDLTDLSAGFTMVIARVTDPDGWTGGDALTLRVAPRAPTDLQAQVVGSSVELTWLDHSLGETGYHIERAPQPKGKASPSWSVIATVGANDGTGKMSYTDNPDSGKWLYRVLAVVDIQGDGFPDLMSAPSNEVLVDVGGGGGGGGGGKGGGPKPKNQSATTADTDEGAATTLAQVETTTIPPEAETITAPADGLHSSLVLAMGSHQQADGGAPLMSEPLGRNDPSPRIGVVTSTRSPVLPHPIIPLIVVDPALPGQDAPSTVDALLDDLARDLIRSRRRR